MNNKCHGCGATLQSTNKDKIGYIPQEKLKDNSIYCERCFKITHYNEKLTIPLDGINNHIIEEINKNKKYVFFLVDFLNINNETMNTFKKINNNKTLVISKLDIIPRSIKQPVITNWLKEEYGITENIIFISSKKSLNTGSITNILERKNEKEAYILGYTNAGKSTLINKLCTENEIKNNMITTSQIPNTTIDFIKIKLNDNITIYDSPGFTSKKTIYEENEYDLINRMNPKVFLKPITHQMKENTNIVIENKIKLSTGNKNSLTFYTSNTVKIEKLFTKTLLDEEELIVYDVPENSDLVIRGLGFVNIKKTCKLKINTKYKELIELRKSMF